MPLPPAGIEWPPKSWQPVLLGYEEHAAWYAGDSDLLQTAYALERSDRDPNPFVRFWSRLTHSSRSYHQHHALHVPIPSEIAQTSSAILFSEEPTFLIPDAHTEKASTEAKATQERLRQIIEEGTVHSRLTEAAEICAALGGVYLKIDWDTSLASVPLLTIVQPDNAIPSYKYGILQAVDLWRTVETQDGGNKVFRHIERHEVGIDGKGTIFHGLYEGTKTRLGEPRDLLAHPDTASLPPFIELPIRGLAIVYVPNKRPNRRFRHMPIGQSDFAQCEPLFDALDETWTSWMRDIRLAKGRILVPQDMIDPDTENGGPSKFDLDQEAFVKLTIPTTADNSEITMTQFEIRADQFERTALNLVERIVSTAGYSPQSFGLEIEGRAESGTALNIRERKTLMTQQTKRRYWQAQIDDLCTKMLLIDQWVFKTAKLDPALGIDIALADSSQPDETQMSETVERISRAGAASTEVLVAMLHPSWDRPQVLEEAQRIRDEKSLGVPFDEELP